MPELTGKVAVVTGGGSGIGRATALLFAARGAHTVLLIIDPDTTVENLELMGQGHLGASHVLDLTDAARVETVMRAIASFYAPHNIRASVICPGLIATPMSTRAQKSERIRARLPALQPLGGDFGSPQDVARAALYLASDDASFVTGAVLAVDGGWTVR